jgi:hypothetical protein
MAQLIVTYWRDIPSQVTIKVGRRGPKRMLSERFQEAIDMAAMRGDAAADDSYMAEWRKGDPVDVEGEPEDAVDAAAAAIEADYDKDRLKELIGNKGWAEPR